MISARYWIKNLNLVKHPEGGYFKQEYESKDNIIVKTHIKSDKITHVRKLSTSIYYLLEQDQFSSLHRLRSDEIWHFYDGDPLNIFIIYPDRSLSIKTLGKNISRNEHIQIVVNAGCWFGAKLIKNNSYCLAGCTMSPGFDFRDFELGNQNKLLKEFPEYEDIIIKLTLKV